RHHAAVALGEGDDDRPGDGRAEHRRTRNRKGGERFGLIVQPENRSSCAAMGIATTQLTPVEQTAFLTVYARALDSRWRRPILGDRLAVYGVGRSVWRTEFGVNRPAEVLASVSDATRWR